MPATGDSRCCQAKRLSNDPKLRSDPGRIPLLCRQRALPSLQPGERPRLQRVSREPRETVIYDEDGYGGCFCVRLPCVRKHACSTSATRTCAHCSSAWQKISEHPAATTSVRLRVCDRRIRTAFYRLLNDWTSWLQPWESSVNEGS
jgi:hypothetical protein